MYVAERQFVTTAQNHLGQLLQSGCDTGAALNEIKTTALALKARAIYRAAVLCEDVLKRSNPQTDSKFQASVARLASLLGMYESGLSELDRGQGALLNIAPEPVPKPVPKPALESISEPAPKAANENAAKLLTPLLALVRGGDPEQALEFLTHYAPGPASQPTKAPAPKPSTIGFETMMGRITNRVLSEARLNAKAISLSYASDFERLDKAVAKEVQLVLEQICFAIIRAGLVDETLTHKHARRVWQISVTGRAIATGQTQHNLISVSWPGYAVSDFQAALSDFQTLGGDIKHKTSKHADRDVVQGVDTGLDIQIIEVLCPLKKPREAPQTGAVNKQEPAAHFPPAVNM